jgi:hypothetical protein
MTAADSSTAGQAPIAIATTCESTNATSPAAVSSTVTRRSPRCIQILMQTSPQAASTKPPSGREPVATATPYPATKPNAAIGALGTRSDTGGLSGIADESLPFPAKDDRGMNERFSFPPGELRRRTMRGVMITGGWPWWRRSLLAQLWSLRARRLA